MLKKQSRLLHVWKYKTQLSRAVSTTLERELIMKTNLKLAMEKNRLQHDIKSHYRNTKKAKAIILKYTKPGPNENVTASTITRQSCDMSSSLQHMMHGVPVPPNLSMGEVEFLAEKDYNVPLPPDLAQIVELYRQSKMKLKDLQKSQEMETKVKQLCYDMMIGVLEEHQNRARSAIGFKPKPLKFHKKKHTAEHEGSSFVKMSSIDASLDSSNMN